MSAYVINQLSIHDTSYQKEYYAKVGDLLAKHGGKQIVGGPPVERLEGDFELPERVAILEFPTIDHARAMWNDPDYAPLIKARQACTEGRVMLVEGKE
jgi:uncharacterized protein (DUF1330 family)